MNDAKKNINLNYHQNLGSYIKNLSTPDIKRQKRKLKFKPKYILMQKCTQKKKQVKNPA